MEYFNWLEQQAEEQRREERAERVERFLDGVHFSKQFEAWADSFEDGDTSR